MIRCEACGKPMRSAWLVIAGRSYGPRCGRPRPDRQQLPLFDEAAP